MSRFWLRAGRWLAVGIPGAVVLTDCVGYPAVVDGTSMRPLLNPDPNEYRDIVFLDRTVTFDFHKIKRGDVIALTSPRDPSKKLIKRVIALQGDSVRALEGNGYVLIPPGHIWVEGDNHKVSSDSNHFGPISLGLTLGRATYILWPPKRISPIESAVSPERSPVHKKHCFEGKSEEEEVANVFV